MTGELVSQLKNELGEDLRAVLIIGERFKPVYNRSDIYDKYSEENIKHIYDEIKASSMSSSYIEECWSMGDHHCTSHIFDEGILLHVINDEREIVITIDKTSDMNLFSVIDLCIKHTKIPA